VLRHRNKKSSPPCAAKRNITRHNCASCRRYCD